jgi:hypothetical protein
MEAGAPVTRRIQPARLERTRRDTAAWPRQDRARERVVDGRSAGWCGQRGRHGLGELSYFIRGRVGWVRCALCDVTHGRIRRLTHVTDRRDLRQLGLRNGLVG